MEEMINEDASQYRYTEYKKISVQRELGHPVFTHLSFAARLNLRI